MPLPLEPMTYSYLHMRSNFVGKNATFSLCFCRFFPVFVHFRNLVFLNFKIYVFFGLYFYAQIPTFFSKSILERIRKCYTDYPFFYDIFSHKNLSSFDLKHVFLKLIFNLSYIISIEVHHKMNRRCDVAMSRTLQKEECAKLLNIFEGGLRMSEAKTPVPIYHKIALTVKEAAELSNIGMNKIDSMLRQPNCPFVLFVGTKKLVKRKEFEQFISNTLIL